jgi:hypothetical protein
LKDGTKSLKKFKAKTTRSGNPMTIELFKCIEIVALDKDSGITRALRDNILALCEIRDNAIHFKNDHAELAKTVLELGTAALKNYLNAVRNWFNKDLSRYNFYLMPLSFFHEFESVSSFSVSKPNVQLNKLLLYLANKASENKSNPDNDYNLLLKVETKFVKSSVEETLVVRPVRSRQEAVDPANVQEVLLREEDISRTFPWPYKELCNRLRVRYSNFKQDSNFNKHIIDVKKNSALCYERKLSPGNPKSQVTYFYNPNCINIYFDKVYTRREVTKR